MAIVAKVPGAWSGTIGVPRAIVAVALTSVSDAVNEAPMMVRAR